MNMALAAAGVAILLTGQFSQAQPGHAPAAAKAAHSHPGPAIAKAPAAPPSIFDATMLGSPVRLDQDWRVGISSDPKAAQPDFDDSAWAVRDALGTVSDVPDEDPKNGKPGVQREQGSNPDFGRDRRFAWFRLHIKWLRGTDQWHC